MGVVFSYKYRKKASFLARTNLELQGHSPGSFEARRKQERKASLRRFLRGRSHSVQGNLLRQIQDAGLADTKALRTFTFELVVHEVCGVVTGRVLGLRGGRGHVRAMGFGGRRWCWGGAHYA